MAGDANAVDSQCIWFLFINYIYIQTYFMHTINVSMFHRSGICRERVDKIKYEEITVLF